MRKILFFLVFAASLLQGYGQNTPTYCTPNIANCTTYRIDSVGFAGMSNVSSACGTNGYSNFTTTVAAPTVQAGSFQQLTVKPLVNTFNKHVYAYFDWNQNGIFESGETTYIGGAGGTVNTRASAPVRIPHDALPGSTRMRVQVTEYAFIPNACNGYYNSETEDYTVNVIASASPAAGFSFYVKSAATGLNTGFSWADAFTSLASALSFALPKDTIKVAAGTYKPGTDAANYFNMKSGVVVLGGFPATGNPTTADRNWRLHTVMLSGELGAAGLTGNTYTMLRGAALSAQTIWDGFVIEHTAGYGTASQNGAVVLTHDSRPVLRNFIFRGNGGATSGNGKAITALNSSPTITNCFFYNNSSWGIPNGVIYAAGGGLQLHNCVFAGNDGSDSASAVFLRGGAPVINNCTFFNNRTGTYGKGAVITAKDGAALNLSNSIFFNNRFQTNYFIDLTDSFEVEASGATVVAQHNLFQNYDGGPTNLTSQNPRFRDTADLDGPDNLFFTADDGLSLLLPCSPALNAGTNAVVSPGTDITGADRLFNNGIVDLGAYEAQSVPQTPLRVVYVNKAATGANNGSSWANAFTDLQQAMLYCADTIKVAAGTYVPSTTNRTVYFELERSQVLLGGYPANGNPTDAQRSPETNLTILSGKMPNGQKSLYVVKSRHADSTTVVDGFQIRESASGYLPSFAGIYLTNQAKPCFRNCRITANSIGFVARNGSAARFENCFVDSNINNGGIIASGANVRFRKSVFGSNTTIIDPSLALYSGGGLYISGASPVFDSCAFLYNRSNLNGGAIYSIQSGPQFNYCLFKGNRANEYGGNCYNYLSNPVFDHCVFQDTLAADYGGSMANISSNPQFLFCEFRNSRSRYKAGLMLNDNCTVRYTSCAFYNTGSLANSNYTNATLTNCIASGTAAASTAFLTNEKAFATLTNVTFVRHNDPLSIAIGGALIYNKDSSRLVIRNSILWGGKFDAMEPKPDILNEPSVLVQPSATTIQNCFTQAYGTTGVNGNIVGVNPRLLDINDPDGLDNQFFTADDGLRLSACSPAVNVGLAGINTEAADILNNPRQFGTIDIGAYELQSTGSPVRNVFVNAVATGGDGTSWTSAYRSLWLGINDICADTVKVAAGVYKPAINNRDSSFLLQQNKVYMGGYPAAGSPTNADRDPVKYPTILSGNIGSATDSTDNSRNVVLVSNADTLVTLDGFVIQDGMTAPSTGTLPNDGGGGVLVLTSKFIMANCIVQKNYAVAGGGINVSHSKRVRISNSVIRNNKALWGGGGLYVSVAERGVDAVIENSVFAENSSSSGGGIYNAANTGYYGASIRFNNLIFYRNEALNVGGGGMYNESTHRTYITNCTFVRNRGVGARGSGIYSQWNFGQDDGFPYIYNCIFKDNAFSLSLADTSYGGTDIFESSCPNYYCYRPNITYNRTQAFSNQYDMKNTGAQPMFINQEDPDGPDNVWLTADDGLRLSACSPLINYGFTPVVANIPVDAIGVNRIINGKPDVGAYEFNGSALGAAIANYANDSLIANKEYTTADGWTHYYKDCFYLMSVKKAGQNIGTVGDGNFRVKIFMAPPYGSGQATNLTAAQYNTGGSPWHAMNRYWNITPKNQVTDSVLVRFPYSAKDFTDLKGSNPALASHEQIQFFKVEGTQNPFSLTIPATAFLRYNHGAVPTLSTWHSSQQDSNTFFCDYFVRSFSGGSGGTAYTGPLSDVSVSYAVSNTNGAAPNGSFTLRYIEKNSSTVAAGAHKLNLYLSADNQLTPNANGDVLLGQSAVASLAGGAVTDTLQKLLYVPCSTTPGSYTLFIVADGEDVLAETSEANNTATIAFTVLAGSALPPVPVIAAAPSATVCAPGNVVLSASTANCPTCAYTWSDGRNGTAITVYSSGTLTLTATNACGSSSASQVVTILPQPNLSVSGLANMCQFTEQTVTASGAATYTWSGPGVMSTSGSSIQVTPPLSGLQTYTLTGVGANGCSRTNNYQVAVNMAPMVNILQTDVTLCAGNSVSLQATSAYAESNTWSPSAALSTVNGLNTVATPSATTKYYFTGTSIYGCKAKDSVTITVLPASGCTPQPDLVISSQSASPASIATGGALNATFTETNQGTAAAGAHKVSFYLSANNLLTPGTNGDLLLGEESLAGLNAATSTAALTKPLAIPCGIAPGSYYLFFVADAQNAVAEINEANNTAMLAQPVSVTALSLNIITADTTVCSGSMITLRATGTAGNPVWSGVGLSSTTGYTVAATPATTTTYTISATQGGCAVSDNVLVTVIPVPVVAVSPASPVACPGVGVTITASGAASYTWSPAVGLSATTGASVTAAPSTVTTYTITGTSAEGCKSNKSVIVTVGTVVTPAISISYTGCPNASLQFTAQLTNGGSAPVVEWWVNDTLKGTGISYTVNNAVNGTKVYAKLISNASCVSVNTVSSAVTMVNCITTAIPNIDVLEQYSLLPNPTSGLFEIRMKLLQRKEVSFHITDGHGKQVLKKNPQPRVGTFSESFDLRGVAQGTFYLQVTIGNQSFVEKVIVVR